MSTPTAAGLTAPFIAITLPTVAPLPKCTSGIAATWWKTQGRAEMFFSCSSATPSICAGSVQARMSALRPWIRCMALDQCRSDAGGVTLALLVRFILRPRPEEAPQAVALAARDHVRVHVGHALRDLVVQADERALRLQAGLDRPREALNPRPEGPHLRGRERVRRLPWRLRAHRALPLDARRPVA